MITATRQQIVTSGMRWLGTPFKHDASVLGVGVDCARLVEAAPRGVGLYNGIILPRYRPDPDPDVMRQILNAFLDPIPFSELRQADVIWFRVVKPQHLGLVVSTDPLTILHAFNGAPERQEVILTRVFGIWRERIVGCFRYRGVVD